MTITTRYCLDCAEVRDVQPRMCCTCGHSHQACTECGSDQLKDAPNVTYRADGAPRMTDAQMLALWRKCGGYNVPFREDDYLLISRESSFTPGFVEGWIGGNLHAAGNPHATIYVGVDPEGRINS